MTVDGVGTFTRTNGGSASDAKLKRATTEFEALLLASLLEKMRDSYKLDGEEQGIPGSDSMSALATQAVATAMASRGGLGLGKMMYEKLRSR